MGKVKNILSRIKQLILGHKKLFKKFKSLSLKKKIAVIIIGFIALIFIFNVFLKNSGSNGYITSKATISDIKETVSETGTITTNGKTEVFSPTNGVVENVYVKNDEIVTKGQELFTVISNATEQEQQFAYANYLAAKAAFDSANSSAFLLRSSMYSSWDTFYGLSTGDNYENSNGSPKEKERESAEFQTAQDNWRAAEKKYKDQQTVILQAQSALNSAWLLYLATQNSIVKAPIDGVITNLSVTSGKSVNIRSATYLDPVLIITNNAESEIKVSLTETDILKIKPDQKATVEIDALKEKTYQGIVTRVDSIGISIQGVIRYNVYIKIINPDDNLRAGMSADVEITTNVVKNVLAVPNSAIKPYKGGKAVRVINPKTKQPDYITVKIGIKGKEKTQIISGVKDKQEVITALSNQQIKRPGLFGN